jgi:hypothetical protein
MSTYDDASLVLVPSGYKNGVVFSQKPMDANGQLTFTRASSATRVGPNGYIEKVRTNLITYSEDLSNAAYTNDPTDGSVTITANYGVAPNGTNTADRVQITRGTNYSQIYQTKSVTAGVEYSFSLYLKSLSGTPTITILYNDNGAVGKATLTSSWVRYTFTYNAPSTSANYPMIALYGADSASCDILAWGLQFETGVPTDYIATTTAAVSVGPVSGTPRLDYLGSDCPRLLLEPARTNSLLWSENFDNGTWLRGSISVTANSVASPDGYTNADTIANTASTAVYVYQLSQASNATWTGSIFAKKGTNKYLGISLCSQTLTESRYQPVFNLENGTLQTENLSGTNISNTSYKIEDYGNGWYRLSATCTFVGGADNCFIVFQHSNNTNYLPSGGSLDWSNATTGNAYFWGAMIEPSAGYSSSYVPTLGTAVTRVADAAGRTSASDLIGQTEGTIFVDLADSKYQSGGNDLWIMQTALNDTNTAILIYYTPAIGVLAFINNGTDSVSLSTPFTLGQQNKIAVAYKNGDYALYLNGVQGDTDSSAIAPPSGMNQVAFVKWLGNSNPQMESINQALLFKTRLTNAQLAELTTL